MKKFILVITLLLSVSAFAKEDCGLVTSVGMGADPNMVEVKLLLESSNEKAIRIVNSRYLPLLLKGLNSQEINTCILKRKSGINYGVIIKSI